MKKISEKEEKQMFKIINEALLKLCRDKPHNPVDYLSRCMLDVIGQKTELLRKKKTMGSIDEIQLSLQMEKMAQFSRPVARKFNENFSYC